MKTNKIKSFLNITYFDFVPFVRSTFSQPTPTATRNMAPKFPGTRILSHINCRGNGFDNLFTFSAVGVSNIPKI